ncbi:hypothetical protein N7494_005679 [Penicillium frequentans]|uniref:Zn(2)-C6 fungal-type domain-containing protein n=1 Tax=Penicillium frequentans TaxID=3151616 RepID=A0AAD6GFB0_9EURO|nr:hypothetical protein N7494_005679 [Penicillium glabrum]
MPESDRVKTCENCVRAKIRCAHTPDSLSCDRCRRLKKECYFRPSRPRGHHKKRTTRIEALEDKIDQIMEQINPRPDRIYPTPKSNDGSDYSNRVCDVIGKGLVSNELANILLDNYREAMQYFPFVMLPGRMTVKELRTEKPFILLCIFVITSFRDTTLQQALEDVLKSYIGDVILHSPHDNHPNALETFQGLLIVLSGSRQLYQLCRFSSYIHIALSIMNDARMDRPPKYRVATRIDIEGESDQTGSASIPGSVSIADESRALIGCFLLNSTHAIIMQKTCTLPWSPFIESCAATLSAKCEYPTDRYMIYYVQLQHMLERMNLLTTKSIEGHPDVELQLQSFRAEVEEYKNQLPIPPTCDLLIATQYQTLELQLCQISLLDNKHTSTPGDGFVLVSRIDTLCHGLAAAKRFVDFYFTLPPTIEKSYSILNWLQTGFIVAAACKLVIVSLDSSLRYNVQVEELREALELPKVLQFYVQRLHEVAKTCKDGEFAHYQNWLLAASVWFEKTYRAASMEVSSNAGAELSVEGLDFFGF